MFIRKTNSKLRHGAAAVEAAVCLPILVAIFLGAVEVSSGILQEYNAQACAYEMSKVALESSSTCEDVQIKAAEILPQLDFETYSIEIEVVPRTENADTVEPAAISRFSIPQSGPTPKGLEDTPRGTLLKLTLVADRPEISGPAATRIFLSDQISTNCVFVKEF